MFTGVRDHSGHNHTRNDFYRFHISQVCVNVCVIPPFESRQKIQTDNMNRILKKVQNKLKFFWPFFLSFWSGMCRSAWFSNESLSTILWSGNFRKICCASHDLQSFKLCFSPHQRRSCCWCATHDEADLQIFGYELDFCCKVCDPEARMKSPY